MPPEIEDFYLEILPVVHGYPRDIDYIGDAYRDMKKILGIFYSPFRFKRIFLLMLNLLANYDVTVLTYPESYDLRLLSQEEYHGFKILFKQAVEEGIDLTNRVIAYLNQYIDRDELEQFFPEISFDGLGV